MTPEEIVETYTNAYNAALPVSASSDPDAHRLALLAAQATAVAALFNALAE